MAYFYEAGNVAVNWNGLNLSYGWAEDTFLTITPNSARVEHKVGADGTYTYSKLSDKGCTITMTFTDVSTMNNSIAAIAAAQDAFGGDIPIASFEVIDLTGDAAGFVALNVVLTEIPEMSYQKASGERTWTWVAETYIATNDPTTITASINKYRR